MTMHEEEPGVVRRVFTFDFLPEQFHEENGTVFITNARLHWKGEVQIRDIVLRPCDPAFGIKLGPRKNTMDTASLDWRDSR